MNFKIQGVIVFRGVSESFEKEREYYGEMIFCSF